MESLHQQLIAPTAPPAVHWWPPAPGWWIVAGLLVILALLLPWLQRLARQRRERRRHIRLDTFADIPVELPANQWLTEINIRLKQQLKQRGDEPATRLHGEAWLDYLCSQHPSAERAVLQPLAADLYRPDVSLSDAQRQALLKALRPRTRHDHV
ncbi:MAG: DUF4381 domain-containing protein [Pseudomonas sp.]